MIGLGQPLAFARNAARLRYPEPESAAGPGRPAAAACLATTRSVIRDNGTLSLITRFLLCRNTTVTFEGLMSRTTLADLTPTRYL
jgi:hypothetical protein